MVRARRVLGMTRVPATFPHHGDEDGGYAVLLMELRSGIAIGLHHHEVNTGGPFAEGKTGLDHIAFNVATRADLDGWAACLDSALLGICPPDGFRHRWLVIA